MKHSSKRFFGIRLGLVLLLALVLAFSLSVCAFADDVAYNVIIQDYIQYGGVEVDKPSAKAGETVTLTAKPDTDYNLLEIGAKAGRTETVADIIAAIGTATFTNGDDKVIVSENSLKIGSYSITAEKGLIRWSDMFLATDDEYNSWAFTLSGETGRITSIMRSGTFSGTSEYELIKPVVLTPDTTNPNVYTFSMPAAPVTVSAEFGKLYPLWVGGTQVTSANSSTNLEWSFDPDNATLQLWGATITGAYHSAAIYAESMDLTINVFSDSTVTGPDDGYGIWVNSSDDVSRSITINGDGRLSVTGGSTCVKASGSIIVNGTLSAATGTTGNDDKYGVDGNIVINQGAVVAVTGTTRAIRGTVTNAIAGLGWTDVSGVEGEAVIAVSEGQALNDYKKVQFPYYTVTFNTDNGEPENMPVLVAVGSTIAAPTTPTQVNMAFTGWFDGTNSVTFPYTPPGNVTLTAQWTDAVASITRNGKTSYYATLQDAFDMAEDDDIVRMISDVMMERDLFVRNKRITLDLNDHGLFINYSVIGYKILWVEDSGSLTLTDNAENKTVHIIEMDMSGEMNLPADQPLFRGRFPATGNGNKTIEVTGGYIAGGYASGGSGGGGVRVKSGSSFTMTGGTICACTTSMTYAGFGDSGGGVYVDADCSFTMTGGTIRDNNSYGNGGGVYVAGTFTMTGGTIRNNNSYGNGGGVFFNCGSSFNLSGNASITDNTVGNAASNVYFDYSGDDTQRSKITLAGALTNKTPIGVLMDGPGVFTSGWTTAMGQNADPADYFTSDSADYAVVLSSSGEAELKEFVTYPVWVRGVQVTELNKGNVLGDGKVSYTPATATLTLNGATITSGYMFDDDSVAAIFADGDLTIDVTGTNTVTGLDNDSGPSVGICVWGNVTVTGRGTLTAIGGKATGLGSFSSGVFADGSVTVNGTLIATGDTVTGQEGFSSGVYAPQGSVIVAEGGTLTATGGEATGQDSFSYGVDASGAVTVAAGGTLIATGGTQAIFGNVRNAVKGTGWTDAAGQNSEAIAIDTTGRKLGNYMRVQFPDTLKVYPVWVGSVQVTSKNKGNVLGDGKVSYTPKDATTPAKLTLNGATIKSTGSKDSHEGAAIFAEEDLTIDVTGTNTVTGPDNDSGPSVGIGVMKAFTVTGSGTLTATGGKTTCDRVVSFGVYANDSVTVSGTLNAAGGETPGSECISAGVNAKKGAVTVAAGGTLKATGGETPGSACMSFGVSAEGAVTVAEGGTLKAEGGTASDGASVGVCAYTGSVTVAEGGMLTATGGTATDGASVGVSTYGNVTVNGTLNATGGTAAVSSYGVSAEGAVTVAAGGTLKAEGGTLTAEGDTQAIDGKVINAVKGTGWTDAGAPEDIGVNTTGQTLDYKKVMFPEFVTYPVWVGGVQVTSANAANITGGETVTASYNVESNTLTLNNYSYSGGGNSVTDENQLTSHYAVLYDGAEPLNIVLTGTNSLACSGDEENDAYYGIRSKGDLTISGTGNASVSGRNTGIIIGSINKPADLVIAGGSVTVQQNKGDAFEIYGGMQIGEGAGTIVAKTDDANDRGVYVYGADGLTVNGGRVTATGGKAGIQAPNGPVVIGNNCVVTATGGTQAIYGSVKNAIAGTGWTNREGTGSGTPVEISATARTISADFKKVYFGLTEPVITGADLVLDGTLTMRFHVALPAGFDDSSAHMVLTIRDRSYDISISEAGTVDGRRTFPCPVYSIEMAEPIKAEFHYTKGGAAKTATRTASIKDYLDALDAQGGQSAELSSLIAAVRNYGHYIQPYLARLHDFKIGAGGYAAMPAASGITPVTAQELDSFKTKWNGYDRNLLESVTYYDTFDTSTYLNIQVKLKSARTLTATVNGAAVEVTALGGNVYAIRTPGIAANNLGIPAKVVFYAGSTVICDIDVSALTYVRAVLASRSEPDELNALTAFYNYNTAARAYMN